MVITKVVQVNFQSSVDQCLVEIMRRMVSYRKGDVVGAIHLVEIENQDVNMTDFVSGQECCYLVIRKGLLVG